MCADHLQHQTGTRGSPAGPQGRLQSLWTSDSSSAAGGARNFQVTGHDEDYGNNYTGHRL